MALKEPKSWKEPSEQSAFRESGMGRMAVSLFSLAAESQLIDAIC